MPHRNARPADLAIATHRMMLELLHLIWSNGFAHVHPQHLGASLELMLVAMLVTVATHDGTPPTASEIGRKLSMPRSNAVRHLNTLIAIGRIKQQGRRYVADLDYLDKVMGSFSHFERGMAVVETCVAELKRLRPLVKDRMR